MHKVEAVSRESESRRISNRDALRSPRVLAYYSNHQLDGVVSMVSFILHPSFRCVVVKGKKSGGKGIIHPVNTNCPGSLLGQLRDCSQFLVPTQQRLAPAML